MSSDKQIIILASKSKRRAEILKSCGIRFKVLASNIREKFHFKAHPRELVAANAREKAKQASAKLKSGVVLGCDTLVLFKGKPIGKPRGKTEARRLLGQFSGNSLFVYTGLCLIDIAGKTEVSSVVKTKLRVRRISNTDLSRYLEVLGPYDKAGGFSIEGLGAVLFDDLEGSYFNVLGLPVGALADLFKNIGLDILDFVHPLRRDRFSNGVNK